MNRNETRIITFLRAWNMRSRCRSSIYAISSANIQTSTMPCSTSTIKEEGDTPNPKIAKEKYIQIYANANTSETFEGLAAFCCWCGDVFACSSQSKEVPIVSICGVHVRHQKTKLAFKTSNICRLVFMLRKSGKLFVIACNCTRGVTHSVKTCWISRHFSLHPRSCSKVVLALQCLSAVKAEVAFPWSA